MIEESTGKGYASSNFLEGQEDEKTPVVKITLRSITITFPNVSKTAYVFTIGKDGKLLRPIGLAGEFFDRAIDLAESAHCSVKIADIQQPPGNDN